MVATKKKGIAKKTTRPALSKNAKAKTALKKTGVATRTLIKKSVKTAAQKAAAPTVKQSKDKNRIVKKTFSVAPVKAISGFPEQMLEAALKVLDDRQAEEIVTIPLAGRSSVADYVIIASGRAGRQVAALADYLREAFVKLGVRKVRIEGMGEANWVLVDAGDIVIHLFRPEVRRYYDLDGIWSLKNVKV